MTFAIPFKEVYIRLVENEPALIYTVRYGGLFGKSTRLPLEVLPEVLADALTVSVTQRHGSSQPRPLRRH
jgi:hypothetical protein